MGGAPFFGPQRKGLPPHLFPLLSSYTNTRASGGKPRRSARLGGSCPGRRCCQPPTWTRGRRPERRAAASRRSRRRVRPASRPGSGGRGAGPAPATGEEVNSAAALQAGRVRGGRGQELGQVGDRDQLRGVGQQLAGLLGKIQGHAGRVPVDRQGLGHHPFMRWTQVGPQPDQTGVAAGLGQGKPGPGGGGGQVGLQVGLELTAGPAPPGQGIGAHLHADQAPGQGVQGLEQAVGPLGVAMDDAQDQQFGGHGAKIGQGRPGV